MYLSDREKQHILSRIKIGDGCWEWTGSKDTGGYGSVKLYNKLHLVHRLIYQIFKKRSLKDIGHTCDKPSCCNPMHLAAMTEAENMQDMVRKGRSAKGSSSGVSKLTEAQVYEIKLKLKARIMSKDLAVQYAVNPSTIKAIKLGTTWNHVKV